MRLALNNKRILDILRALSPILFFFVLWEVVSRIELVEPTLFPPPTQVLVTFVKMLFSGVLIRDSLISASRATVGYFAGSITGISLGLLMGRSTVFRNILFPIFQMLRPIPPITYVPFAILWFGIGEIRNESAHTGAPARARTILTPIVLRNVVFPAILGPVIMTIFVSPSNLIELLTLSEEGIKGCPTEIAFRMNPESLSSGIVQFGWL